MTHFLETLYGTKHQSFVISKVLTPFGYVFGPTIYQGLTPPDPATDSITGSLTNGDIWIQTGPAPSLNQYIGNAWVALAVDPNDLPMPDFNDLTSAIANAVANTVTFADLATALANVVTTTEVANTVAGAFDEVLANIVTFDDLANAVATTVDSELEQALANVVTFSDLANTISASVDNALNAALLDVDFGNVVRFDDLANTVSADVDNALGTALMNVDLANVVTFDQLADTVTTTVDNELTIALANTVTFDDLANTISATVDNALNAALLGFDLTNVVTFDDLANTVSATVDNALNAALLGVNLANVVTFDDLSNTVSTTVDSLLTVALANVVTVDTLSDTVADTVDEALTTALANVVSLADLANTVNDTVADALDVALANVITFADLTETVDDALDDALANVVTVTGLANTVNNSVEAALDTALANVVTVMQLQASLANAISTATATALTFEDLANTVTNSITQIVAPLADPSLLIVSTVVYDGVPDGSALAPFNSVQAAVDAAGMIDPTQPVVISLAPGSYSENVTISRPLTYLTGSQGYAGATTITGMLTIQPNTITTNTLSSTIGVENLSLVGTGPVLCLSGPVGFNFIARDLAILATMGDGFVDTVTTSHRVEILHGAITAQGGDAFTIANASCFLHHLSLNSDLGSCYVQTNTIAAIDTSTMVVSDANAVSSVVEAAGGSLSLTGCGFTNAGLDGNGLQIAADSFVQVTTCGFNISNAGAGLAIVGVSGASLAYANIWFAANSSTSISDVLAAGLVALPTAPTFA